MEYLKPCMFIIMVIKVTSVVEIFSFETYLALVPTQ